MSKPCLSLCAEGKTALRQAQGERRLKLTTSYAIAIGSNRRHGRLGSPGAVVRGAVDAISGLGAVEAVSRIRSTPAQGPAGRSFANAAITLTSSLKPLLLLSELKALEREFGRRPGRRWGARVLDLDIILWSEGAFADDRLLIPHPEFRVRDFVLAPLAEIAPGWRDPIGGASVRQLLYRHRCRTPVDRRSPRP